MQVRDEERAHAAFGGVLAFFSPFFGGAGFAGALPVLAGAAAGAVEADGAGVAFSSPTTFADSMITSGFGTSPTKGPCARVGSPAILSTVSMPVTTLANTAKPQVRPLWLLT